MEQPHFETRAERRARKRQERGLGRRPAKAKWWWGAGSVVVVAGFVAWLLASTTPGNDPVAKAQAHEQLMETCVSHTGLGMHIHSKLFVIVDGQEQAIPANVGIEGSCLHPVHTHDTTGIIHIESPRQDDFTLTDFFKMWEKDFTPSSILGHPVTSGTQLKMFANGQEIPADPAMVMADRTTYAIMLGKADQKLEPPAFTFPNSI